MTKLEKAHRTKDLRVYLMSDEVSEDSSEFIPMQGVISLLETTMPTIRKRIEDGELQEKTLFLKTPERKTFLGVEAGGVKRLLILKTKRREILRSKVLEAAKEQRLTTYTDLIADAGMRWDSPPDRLFCSRVLMELANESFDETIDSGNGIMVSAVVVSRNEHIPTQNFFEHAVKLTLMCEIGDREQQTEFWKEQLRMVYEYYSQQ
ncbi:MAG: hypothetical protein GJ680_17160 [Alteromonadaceae bacterium]|nr:hypothetical protein [Alteromonadaceae bacterium]